MIKHKKLFICGDGTEFAGELDAILHETQDLNQSFIDGIFWTLHVLEKLNVPLPFPMGTDHGRKPIYVVDQVYRAIANGADVTSISIPTIINSLLK